MKLTSWSVEIIQLLKIMCMEIAIILLIECILQILNLY